VEVRVIGRFLDSCLHRNDKLLPLLNPPLIKGRKTNPSKLPLPPLGKRGKN